MKLTGLHLLLTYQCNLACDHCFVWGSPWQTGAMTLHDVRDILQQAKDLETVDWIYFEGGEPFLFYAILLKGVRSAALLGFKVGIVTNDYWATDPRDAVEWLRPFAGVVQDFSISSDLYHWSKDTETRVQNAAGAAQQLEIPMGVISIAQPETADSALGQLPHGESAVMYRGRATKQLAHLVPHHPWETFTECPYENLREPSRVHIDPLGHVHICQGISLGNMFETPLSEICANYDPDAHPITGPLLAGGPAEFIRRYDLTPEAGYADACHLCYTSRLALRDRFPEELAPDQMYGVYDEG